jgi:predicted GTPase
VAVLRHPMPYGDLTKQAVQRFEHYEDLDAADATIEEREEYEPHLAEGNLVYAGVDYERILRAAEKEADVILWDGGNNDTPFVEPDLHIVVLDPHRPGHELRYHPGETNLRMADVCVVNKVDSAPQEGIDAVLESIRANTKDAQVILAASPYQVEGGGAEIKGKRVLAVEDGPTLTHGEMTYGAAVLAAKQHGAAELIDPRTCAVGSIAKTFEQYPNVGKLLPAMGYGREQMEDLRETIHRCDAELVLIGTPVDLRRLIELDKPALRVTYRLQEMGEPTLRDVLAKKGLLETALV